MFDTSCNADRHICVMMLTVELKKISETPVSLLVLSKCVSCWLASLHNVQHCITNIAKSTCHCEVIIQNFVVYINSQSSHIQDNKQFALNSDEPHTFLTWNMD